MTPLNLYLETATPEEIENVVREYGDAIRDLAIANVFAGDMLWRNFGVNRHGRVVFYDYDEIEYLTDCVFRAIPPAPNPEAELSGEPWYPVGPLDVFPEEFETFLLGSPKVREAFMRHHADLLGPEFWQRCQEQVSRGEIVDFWPYPEALRFGRRYAVARGEPTSRVAGRVTTCPPAQIPRRARGAIARRPRCLGYPRASFGSGSRAASCRVDRRGTRSSNAGRRRERASRIRPATMIAVIAMI